MTVPFDRRAAIQFWRDRTRSEPFTVAERRAYVHLLQIPAMMPGDLGLYYRFAPMHEVMGMGAAILPLYRMRALPAPFRAEAR